jgi:hypothetical protein
MANCTWPTILRVPLRTSPGLLRKARRRPFAANISFQPDIRGLAYVPAHDGQGSKLYATLAADEEVLEYDESGNSTVFADSSDHLDFPASIAPCPGRR